MDQPQNNHFNMDGNIMRNVYFERAVPAEKIEGSPLINRKSNINMLEKMGLMHLFGKPEELHDVLQKKYKSTENFTKLCSTICRHLNEGEKVAIFDSLNPDLTNYTKEHKKTWVKCHIRHVYERFNHAASKKNKTANPDQIMSEDQAEFIQPFNVLVDKLMNRLSELEAASGDIYDIQFIVAALMLLLGSRNRRLDIGLAKVQKKTESDNVVLQDDGSIFIKIVNKTNMKKEIRNWNKNVLIEFDDPHLSAAVDRLKKIRIARNQDYLFMKEKKDDAPTYSWFGDALKDSLEKHGIGEGLTVTLLRDIYAIELSRKLENSGLSQIRQKEQIEDRMAHCWETHQRRYNLKKKSLSLD